MPITKNFKSFLFLFLSFFCNSLFASELFWNYPTQVTSSPSAFPGSASNGELGVVVWQEVDKKEGNNGTIWLSMQVYTQGKYVQKIRLFGPFDFVGDVPAISSVAVNKKGIISVSVLKDQDTIGIYTSADKGETWREIFISPENLRAVGPRIRVNSLDEFCLFASTTADDGFQLIWSRSADGLTWSEPAQFLGTGDLPNPFIPYFTHNGTTDFVVFQSSMQTGNRFVYQLYFSSSDDGGITWSEPVLLTNFQLPGDYVYSSYHNQRPNMIYHDGKLKLTWERTYMNSQASQIYYTELDKTGKTLSEPVCISSGYSTCSWPELFEYNDEVYITWFESLSGESTSYIADYGEEGWQAKKLATTDETTTFAVPLLCEDDFYMFWLQENSDGINCLMRQYKDNFASPPTFTALSFKRGVSSAGERVRIRVNLPMDSSGIAGFSYIWSRNEKDVPPPKLMRLPEDNEITEFATDDETSWFLIARTVDLAGNWSEPARIEYVRDVTPPLRPIIRLPELDDLGFAVNNSPTFRWQPNPADDDVVGYSYSWNFMGDLPPGLVEGDEFVEEDVLSAPFDPPKPPLRLVTRGQEHSIRNADDGIWAFSVRAIDRLGNIGEAAVIRVFMNKYIPETLVHQIVKNEKRDGSTEIILYGKGFLRDGVVNAIFLDKDGVAPYDYSFSLDRGDYEIRTDKEILSLYVDDVEANEYHVILNHTDRGLYTAPMTLVLTTGGTIKYGDFTTRFLPKLQSILVNFFIAVPIPYILILLLFLLFLVSGIFYIRAIKKSLDEAKALNKEAIAILKGDHMTEEAKIQTQKLQLKGFSLRWKLSFFVLMLLISVSLSISIPLGFTMHDTQQRILTKSLTDRVSVLLESLSSGVRTYLPGQNVLELSLLPQQSSALPEVGYVTILGLPASGENVNINYVWATNDDTIEERLDNSQLIFGTSRLTGDEITAITAECLKLNEKAVNSVGEMTTEVERLTREGIALAAATDEAATVRRREIGNSVSLLSTKINSELNSISKSGMNSYPKFSEETLSSDNMEYLFYAPVLYRQGGEQTFVRGVVILQVSTEILLEELNAALRLILIITGSITGLALLSGLIGAIIFSSMLIRPLRILSHHVYLIRDTEDKEELAGKTFKIRSRDEIGLLGDAINDMTDGLVKAAAAAKDLSVGKETQKRFIPLQTDITGRKLTTAALSAGHADFFGYYEGAKGVSGDYFDFKKLDARHYGIIKCDVAGKGVPASLIMVEVATLFSEYFGAWKLKEDGYDLTPFVSRLNDMLDERGFKGRFAAFTLCIFDAVSGDLYFCNAGDSLLHFYNAASGQKITDAVPETPAAGVFPTFLVNTKGGFPMQKRHLEVGDVLFLYTDGIEEAQRLYRDEKFRVITDKDGIDNEQMSPERVNEIIEAVFAKTTYVLDKVNNPIPNEKLEFDFSTCNGTVEDAIMALVSIEKIFRMYKPPKATERDEVLIDTRVDEFLNAHFKQYGVYCTHRRPHSTDPQYLWYTHVMEDPQYDDLTILGVQKW